VPQLIGKQKVFDDITLLVRSAKMTLLRTRKTIQEGA
jgi:hypothetical protein